MTGGEEARLPALLEVQALIRRAQGEGGFGVVVSRGDQDAGTLLLLTIQNGGNPRLWERVPQASGGRKWQQIEPQHIEKYGQMDQYLDRRRSGDPDMWIIELDVPDAERFIGLTS